MWKWNEERKEGKKKGNETRELKLQVCLCSRSLFPIVVLQHAQQHESLINTA